MRTGSEHTATRVNVNRGSLRAYRGRPPSQAGRRSRLATRLRRLRMPPESPLLRPFHRHAMRVVALLVLCATSCLSSCSAASLHDDYSSIHTHRLSRRSGADTAGAVVGVIVFFLFVGFCWIMCQHPQWNPCGECGCCSACAAGPKQHPYVTFVKMGPRHWLWVASRGRWGAKGAPPVDLEMQALGDDFARLHAQAQAQAKRQPSYEKRHMRIPSPSPEPSSRHSHSHSQSRDSNATPEPPRDRHGRQRSHGSLHVPEPERVHSHSHSRTRSEAVDRRPRGQSHERSTSDPTNRAFAEVFGERGLRPPPTAAAPPARGRNDAIDRWRKAVAGE